MFLNTIDRKPLIKDNNGNFIRDLTQSIFKLTSNTYLEYSVFRVPSGIEMRPDLISQSAYNNTSYAEYILKFNGISNPFTIAPNDKILIPSLDSAKKIVVNRGDDQAESEAKKIRNSYKYIDPAKAPKRDGNLSKFDDRELNGQTGDGLEDGTAGDNLQEGALPPNIAPEGQKGITYRNGRVYFGEGIGQSACLKNGMSQSEFLTKVIRSKKV
jgi:hypothetical protein